jgi:dihydrofolate synthase/folylpolyglutamate synthase
MMTGAMPGSLTQWQAWLEQLDPSRIAPGLDRIREAANRLGLLPLGIPIVLVAGTNGKGSVCRLLESAILRQAGSTFVYGSPHLVRINERIRVNGRDISDTDLVDCLQKVFSVAHAVPLSYFEFTTLAAMVMLRHVQPDFGFLEVGLGGRWDATNIVEPDLCLITSIGLDHQDWLGDTRLAIGMEKAGICRPSIPVIMGDPDPPEGFVSHLEARASTVCLRGREFDVEPVAGGCRFRTGRQVLTLDATPPLLPDNIATALCALDLLGLRMPVDQFSRWAMDTRLAGRMQDCRQEATGLMVTLDVAHNVESVEQLVHRLVADTGPLRLVIGMLSDKPVEAVIRTLGQLGNRIEGWWVSDLPGPRGLSAGHLAQHIRNCGLQQPLNACSDPVEACKMAGLGAAPGTRIVVTGSFLTVGAVLEAGGLCD